MFKFVRTSPRRISVLCFEVKLAVRSQIGSAPEIIDFRAGAQFVKETLNRTSGTDFAIDFFGDCVCQREIAAQSHSRMCIAIDVWSLLSISGAPPVS